MISSSLLQLTVLMSLLALSFERPLAGYNYQVPDNPLVLPKRRTTTQSSTTTTSKPPEEGGTYNYPVPEDSLILPAKNTPSLSATDKKQAKKTFSPQPKKTVPAVGEGKEKRTETTTKKSYDYPVPENPLTFPPPQTKKPESTTPITTTSRVETTETITEKTTQPSIETSEIPNQKTGYEYPTPENPLKPGTKAELPPCQVVDTNSVDLRESQIPGVDCIKESSQYEPQNTEASNLEGYQYPPPENPWKPYDKLPECDSEIEKEIRELMNTIGTDLFGLAMHIKQVAEHCEGKDTSDNNQIDLRTADGLENEQILDCSNVQQELQKVMKTIGTDLYGLAKFAQSCSKKAKTPEDSELPPCLANPIDDFSLDLRSQDEVIPGVTCRELPPCPAVTADNSIDLRTVEDLIPGVTCKELPPCPTNPIDDFSIDLRSQDEVIPGVTCRALPPCPAVTADDSIDLRTAEDLIPGVTCKELPPCPVTNYALGLIQDLTQEEIVPGVTCKELPVCPPYEDRNSEDILGITCRPLPPCPVSFDDVPDVYIRAGEIDQAIPGVTCENLPPCPVSEETEFVPGLTCRILPLCPILDLTEYEDSNEYFVPGVTCQPRPDIYGLENENFRVDLSELPDFSPDYYLEESAGGSFDNIPVPLTTPSTPIKDNVPIPDQTFAKVFVLEPVIVRSCEDMASQASQEEGSNNELPNPGINCDPENIEGASSSAIGLNSLDWPIGPTGPSGLNSPIVLNGRNGPKEPASSDPESENLQQEFTILLPVSSETPLSTLQKASVVKEQPKPTKLGIDFNLATGGFFQVPKSA